MTDNVARGLAIALSGSEIYSNNVLETVNESCADTQIIKVKQKVEFPTNGLTAEHPLVCKNGYSYIYGEAVNLYVRIEADSDNTYAQSFTLKFKSGDSPTTLQILETDVVVEDGFEIVANRYYEANFKFNEMFDKWFMTTNDWSI